MIQINEQNKLFKAGKSSFFEELNANSDVPRDLFEKEKTGYVPNQKMGRGLVLRDESEWFTHPDLEELYQSLDRQALPASFDARAIGLEYKQILFVIIFGYLKTQYKIDN